MNLALSVRIAEGFLSKEEAVLSLPELADLAVESGYDALCMRASQVGVDSPPERIREAREILEERKLGVGMISGDFDIVYNNDRGPDCLYNIAPYLDLAESLGAPLIRVCIKKAEDLAEARKAADEAAERGLKLVHQCHAASLFETVDGIVEAVEGIDRSNFGLVFEAGNLDECGQDYGTVTIRRLAPWIFNVYLQNQRMNPEGAVTLETYCRGPVSFDILQMTEADGIDFPGIFKGLKEVGYDGTVTVHQSAPDDGVTTPVESASRTAAFLKELIGNL